ncbi:MAG TPA: glycosyltransferase family 2 protein [bacterium]|jgi:cellulose synthase/poly-beta-1,6-N-acetylglucosamine synthase-like glycosyltransferase
MTTPELVAAVVFWLCVGAMFHTYVLYPLTLQLFRRRYATPPVMPEDSWPRVAVLVPAYNEEKVIAAKIENCLALDYPADKLEILVGSDGSKDRTNEIVRSYGDSRLHLIELPGRSGKTGVLNRLVTETGAEIIVFSDANVMIEPAALRLLIRHFADDKVGVAGGGKYILIPAGAEAVHGEALYGNYENRLRAKESAVGGMSGALGSLMAMRRVLYRPYASGSTNDDTVPSIWATLGGYRNVYDPQARAFEESGRSVNEEFRRRIRIGAGNFQTLFRYFGVLHPRCGICAYTFFSHKVLRWIFPFLMLGALVSNLFLLSVDFYRFAMAVQVIGYGAVLLGFLLDRVGLRLPLLTALYHFVALNMALFIGFLVYGRGITTSAWEPTARKA